MTARTNGNGKKTAPKTVGRPFAKGADPRRGYGKPGRSGRLPNQFKAELESIRNEEIPQRIRHIIETGKPESAEWRWAVDRVLEYTTSKAPQKQELGGGDDPITIRVIREKASGKHD
jgi:hypothetical protein